ncbi:ketol-acid reductoisomerase [Erysipelotrichaceae bacterium OttesenSCG-928-M19]|nr:ketol-acid reductoisomerase [Erysipelotrichaceae bacterium OttesenSCG-928-M19]
MKKVYLDKDINEKVLKDKKIAIIGYGSQGHAHAQNLKDSGFEVCVGLNKESKSVTKAQANGLEVYDIATAAKQADIIMLLVPDEVMPEIYEKDIKDNLDAGNYLAFAHAFNVHYNQIVPPEDVNVFMVAPKSPGHMVRRQYENGKGVPALYAVYQDKSNNTELIAKAYAKGIGSGRSGILETTFKEEVETDLFGEQVVLCGGVVELMKSGFEVLVEAGYSQEAAYFECVNEMKLIIDMIYEGGIMNMNNSISNTAEFGEYVVGKKIITQDTKQVMREVLEDIKNGDFAKEFILEEKANNPKINAHRQNMKDHSIEKIGTQLRKLMTM